jgi:hypothetical protein
VNKTLTDVGVTHGFSDEDLDLIDELLDRNFELAKE